MSNGDGEAKTGTDKRAAVTPLSVFSEEFDKITVLW